KGEIELIDRRSDVFSLGAMLFEILTGQPLYSGGRTDRREQATVGPGPAALAALSACGADPELIELTRRCLAVPPSDRPADAGEVAKAVESYLETVQQRLRRAEVQRAAADAQAQQAQMTARAERRARRLTAALAAAAIVMVGVAGAGLWWWHDHQAAEAQFQREREAQAALRRERAASAVDAALREAAVALAHARSLVDEPERAEAPLMVALG